MNGDNGSGGFVTQKEFDRTLIFLEEIRQDIKGDVAALSAQLAETKTEITERQDIANGRTSKNELAVVAATRQVEAVAQQVGTVQATVSAIQTSGCQRAERHQKMVSALAQAGVVADTGELLDVAEASRWTKKHLAGVGLGGLGLGVLAPHLCPAVHWLVHLVTGTP